MYAIATPAVNSSRTLNGSGLLPGALSGSDAEDGTWVPVVKWVSPPPTNGNELWYNGEDHHGAGWPDGSFCKQPYIIAYNVGLLAVKFTGVNSTLRCSTTLSYDAASQKSTVATIRLPGPTCCR